eukprot:758797-Rhodomonas_salina.1
MMMTSPTTTTTRGDKGTEEGAARTCVTEMPKKLKKAIEVTFPSTAASSSLLPSTCFRAPRRSHLRQCMATREHTRRRGQRQGQVPRMPHGPRRTRSPSSRIKKKNRGKKQHTRTAHVTLLNARRGQRAREEKAREEEDDKRDRSEGGSQRRVDLSKSVEGVFDAGAAVADVIAAGDVVHGDLIAAYRRSVSEIS